MVRLKGRLPQKSQFKSNFSCETVQIHSLFRDGFIKKPNQNSTEIENIRILSLCHAFRKTDLGIDLIASAFRGSIQNTRLFSIFSSFIFRSIIYVFGKMEEGLFLLTLKGSFKLFIIFIQRMVSPMVIVFSTKCFLVVYIYIDLIKLKAYKLFENSDADLSWLLF